MLPQHVRWLQIENTTRCNASCSVCDRNDWGYNTKSNLQLLDLDDKQLKLNLEMFPNLELIELCGNRGDSIAAKNFSSQLDVLVDYISTKNCKISFSTNGSLRNKEWWTAFGKQLSKFDHNVVFAIDGLEDTNHIYKQRTNFNKIIDNARSFIASGGRAIWKFLPFKHNEHQILDALKLSRELGFVDFKFVKKPVVPLTTFDWKQKQFIKIHAWSQQQDYIPNHIDATNCDHLRLNQVYMSAEGKFHLCCHLQPSTDPVEFNHLPEVDKTFAQHPSNLCLEKCGKYVSIG